MEDAVKYEALWKLEKPRHQALPTSQQQLPTQARADHHGISRASPVQEYKSVTKMLARCGPCSKPSPKSLAIDDLGTYRPNDVTYDCLTISPSAGGIIQLASWRYFNSCTPLAIVELSIIHSLQCKENVRRPATCARGTARGARNTRATLPYLSTSTTFTLFQFTPGC